MSGASRSKGTRERVVQALALALVFGLMMGLTRVLPDLGAGSTTAAVGFLLLAGVLASELCELVGLPHLSGYLLAGIVAGPHVLHLLHHETVTELSPVNGLALSLIALAGGAELRISDLRAGLKSLAWSTLLQSTLVLLACSAAFMVASRYLPFLQGMSRAGVFGVAILWGVLSITRSPAALLGILSQTRAQGPVSRFGLNFVMSSDVVVIIVLALAFMVSGPLIEPGTELSLHELEDVFHEILGSVAIGTTFGLVLAAYFRLVGRALLVVLVALGFGLTDVVKYMHFDPLLVFIIGGLVVQNLSNQGDKLLHAVEETGSIVYVVFFATAGAHLDLPLLAKLWPVALGLAGGRALFTYGAHLWGSRLADDPPNVRRYGWTPLVSQAGLALGLALVVANEHAATFGPGFQSLAIAMVAINEMVGPVLFKWALDRAGETRTGNESAGTV
ncbi:MAG TPA: sodium:proton exchanger [Polyangiaceae bacterium]|nr:sodium:proton exchanger [Polyangiaceae bacterium]